MQDRQASPDWWPPRWPDPYHLGVVALGILLWGWRPHSLWEGDEVLFMKGIKHFDPLHHQPHPPGYPLLIGLGKIINLLVHDPFKSLVALSFVSSLVAFGALVTAFERIASKRVAICGALLFLLSPAMLVYGTMALSDPAALMFLALALAAAARDRAVWLGLFASAAIGCRPQLALAVLPMLAVALWQAPKDRRGKAVLLALAAFTVTSLLWFVPLVLAVGGPSGLVPFLTKQAGLVAQYDASMPRAWRGAAWVAVRFLAHPWGTRWTSLPVLALAGIGIVTLAAGRQVRALPLAVLCTVDLAFGMLVMNPFDAVRYALPSLLGVAFAAAVGCDALARRVRAPWAAWLAAALLAVGFIVYTQPFLAVRARTDSPPVQAAHWIERSVSLKSVLVVDTELAPHASYLLREYLRIPSDPALQKEPEHLLTRPDILLGDGESSWPGSVKFLWPESDAYGKLTRGHFRVITVSPIPPDRWYVPVRGVYAFEPSIRQPLWRWLAPEAAIRFRARRATVRLGLPGHAPLESVAVTVAVDGAPVATVDVPRGGSRTVAVPLPVDQEAEIAFRSATSFVPAEKGMGPDFRRLSVQLQAVEPQAP